MLQSNYKIVYQEDGIEIAESLPQVRTIRMISAGRKKNSHQLAFPYMLWGKSVKYTTTFLTGFRNEPWKPDDFEVFMPMLSNIYEEHNICLGEDFDVEGCHLHELISQFWISTFTGSYKDPEWPGEYLRHTSLKNIDAWERLTRKRPHEITSVTWAKQPESDFLLLCRNALNRQDESDEDDNW